MTSQLFLLNLYKDLNALGKNSALSGLEARIRGQNGFCEHVVKAQVERCLVSLL